ncbi:MAG: radical SAM protein [Thermodesulfobacteriota bacterium]
MADKFRIDSHKLMYHPERVAKWLGGEDIYPIYVEISPSGACNHRCTYCALDYMGYQHRFLETEMLKTRLTEMGRLGIKSVMYAGEGEPFLHKDIASIINHTVEAGIDVAVTSNGVLFTEKMIRAAMRSITWIKISINGATKETYAKMHRTDEEDLKRVIDNLTTAVKVREAEGLSTAIGMQLILLPENVQEVLPLARLARDIGVDYLVIKPYSQHLKSITTQYESVDYSEFYHIAEELKEISTENFNAIFRINTMKKLSEEERGYRTCLALPFWSYIDSGSGLWGCSAYLSDERFHFGNLTDSTFEELWKGEKRRKTMEFVKNELDASECRVNCRMDSINRFLRDQLNPPAHVNFV